MTFGHCKLNPKVINPQGCKNCHESWPTKSGSFTRASCKRRFWVGQADVSFSSENNKVSLPARYSYVAVK